MGNVKNYLMPFRVLISHGEHMSNFSRFMYHKMATFYYVVVQSY
jgi:hypothetical protein